MSLIKELEDWKKDLEALSGERSKAEGRYEQAMETLRNMGYASIEEAEAAVVEMKKELEKAETEAAQLLETFKERYAGYIE